jgi:hypothetical protein
MNKRYYLKTIITMMCSIVAIVFVNMVAYLYTSGFKVNKVLINTLAKQEAFLNVQQEIDPDIRDILSQTFYYIGKGRQVYVFESDDKKYVIKLSRQYKYKYPLWADVMSSLHCLMPYQHKILEEKSIRKKRANVSYMLAYNDLMDETKLIFQNYGSNRLYNNVTIKIRDKANREFYIDLNRVEMLLQQKANSLNKVLKECACKDDVDGIKMIIESYINLCYSRACKGIWNRDYCNYFRNIGWDGNSAVEIDVGSFYRYDPPTTFEEEMDRCFDMLFKFVNDELPQYKFIADDIKKTFYNQ